MADLVFNVIDWHVEDYCEDEDDTPVYLMKLFGKTREGKPVSLECTDYTSHFYVKPPAELNPAQVKQLELVLAKRFKAGFLGAKLLSRKDFWGYKGNRHFQYVQLLFKNETSMRHAGYMFDKPVAGVGTRPIKFTVCESNVPPFLRFCHKQQIRPCGWVRVPEGKYKLNMSLVPTTTGAFASAKWSSVEGVEMDAIAPLLIASFDIECVPSFDDEFPTAIRDPRRLAQRFVDAHRPPYEFFWDLIEQGKLRPQKKVDIAAALKACAGDLEEIRDGAMGYAADSDVLLPLTALRQPGHVDIVKDLAVRIAKALPRFEGDPVIMLGTTTHVYGEQACSGKHIFVLGTCEPIPGATLTCYETERAMLLGWTDFIRRLDPDVFLSWNGFGFDFEYVCDRAAELGCVGDFCKLGRIHDRVCELKTRKLSSSALGDDLMKVVQVGGRLRATGAPFRPLKPPKTCLCEK